MKIVKRYKVLRYKAANFLNNTLGNAKQVIKDKRIGGLPSINDVQRNTNPHRIKQRLKNYAGWTGASNHTDGSKKIIPKLLGPLGTPGGRMKLRKVLKGKLPFKTPLGIGNNLLSTNNKPAPRARRLYTPSIKAHGTRKRIVNSLSPNKFKPKKQGAIIAKPITP